MKKIIILLLMIPNLIFSEEWSNEVFQTIINGCANEKIKQGYSKGDSFEFCACTTNMLHAQISVEELIEAEKSGELFELLKNVDEQNDISITCSAKLLWEF